jgi:hypothetical protein
VRKLVEGGRGRYLAGAARRRRRCGGGGLALGLRPREQVGRGGVGAPHRRRPLHLLLVVVPLCFPFLSLGVSFALSLSKKGGGRCETREVEWSWRLEQQQGWQAGRKVRGPCSSLPFPLGDAARGYHH